MKYIVFIIVLVSCTTTNSYRPYGASYLPYQGKVEVLSIYTPIPTSCIRLGEVHVYDGGLAFNCDYETVLDQAQQLVAKAGGDTLKLTKISTPNFWVSSCYRIRGDVLLCQN